MTDLRIVHMTADGKCAVTEAAEKRRLPDETDEAFLGRVVDKLRHPEHPARIDGDNYVILHKDEIPGCEHYRAARKLDGKRVVFDMDKARAMHKDRIRAARLPMLAALDAEVSRAMFSEPGLNPSGRQMQALEKERQRLRDATAHPSIANAQTIEELRAAWPL